MSYLRKKYIKDSSDSESDNDTKSISSRSDSDSDSDSEPSVSAKSKSIKTPVKSQVTKKNNTKPEKKISESTTKKSKKESVKYCSDISDDSDGDNISDDENTDDDNDNKKKSPKNNLKNIKKVNDSDEELLKDYNQVLKKYWGYDGLKQTQFEIIKKILVDKVDVCAILATGFGKSLCYQLPHLISKKSVIVVSPLIALMHEQGQEMENKKVPVAVFNSESSTKRKNDMKKEILGGKNKLIYMTPEYLIKSEEFIKAIEDELAFVCIDEAHAVSTWGLDFRPGYTKLGVIREWVPSIPILTLTATASTKVREDIIKILRLSNPLSIIGNFDRPNLLIRVEPRQDDIVNMIEVLINKYKNDYVIIYCKTRDETDLLKLKISSIGIPCEAYHAGMSDINRTLVQQQFIDGEIKCIIATIAFGMGINIPNVRLVVHFNCPKNMESYYQEIGRAGRDGKASECVLFYSSKDFKVNRYFLQSIDNPAHKLYQEQQIRTIEQYVFSTECRRKLILKNFGQIMESCTNCDNCLRKIKNEPVVSKVDYTMEVLMVLNILVKMNEKFGTGMIINILLGRDKKVKDWMKNYAEFGSGISSGDEEWWKSFIRLMINDELIQETQVQRAFFSTLGLATKGVKLRAKLMGKYPDYTSLTIAQNSDDNSSYDQFKIMFPKIPNNQVTESKSTKKINKSTKGTKNNNKTKITQIKTVEVTKINKSTKQTKQTKQSNTQEINDINDIDEIIGSSSYRLKKKFNLDSDSD